LHLQAPLAGHAPAKGLPLRLLLRLGYGLI
jgi:hypothetical protein